MEAFLASAIGNILLGVVGNVLTEVLFRVTGKGYKLLKGNESLQPSLDKALAPIIQKAVAKLARSSQYNDQTQTKRLQIFLDSPEVESIVRQIYASKLISSQSSSIDAIRKEFVTLFSLNLNTPQKALKPRQASVEKTNFKQSSLFDITFGESQESLEITAQEIFDSILEGCEQALQIAINKGTLSDHEANSNIRYQMLHDELAAIQKNLNLLTGKHINVQAILDFKQKYRQQITSRHGYITPPNFDTARKLPIDKLYVCPNFISIPRYKDENLTSLKIEEFCSSIYRVVLLGNPGGGKSTFTDKLCNDLATRYEDRLLAGRQVTPIHVILRDYGAAKKKHNCSILEFIQTTAVSKYQLTTPPQGGFEYLLLNGHLIVIFDGLDELLDTSYRQTISGDVESFCSLYPSVPVLVTSREVGYKEAPLDEEKFAIFILASFDDNQIKDYVSNWLLATESELEKEQHTKKVEAFMDESKVVPDLRSNPLMLALLCNIYRGEGYIPRNRPDVYEKCAVMLFERWDRSRGIQVSLPFESRIIFAMMYLAHWIYTNETLQGGVTEQELISKATEYLCQRQFEDIDEAEKAAVEFIEFCRGRAWVFTDTGTMKEGERLYQFTHRTFLEYFTASHLVRVSRSPENLQESLLPKISRREWDVVGQLAFRIQDKQTEGSGDELLTALIRKAHEAHESERWNLLSFAARCLKFMVPSPGVRRAIVKECIEFCIQLGLGYLNGGKEFQIKLKSFDVDQPIRKLLYELLNSTIENRSTIADAFQSEIIKCITESSGDQSFIAYEIGCHLNLAIFFHTEKTKIFQEEDLNFWQNVSKSIFNACLKPIKSMSSQYYRIGIHCLFRKEVTIIELINWYGVSSIFKQTKYVVYPRVRTSPVAENILINSLFPLEKQDKYIHISYLDILGKIFISYPLPLISESLPELNFNILDRIEDYNLNKFQAGSHSSDEIKLPPSAVFAAFVIVAVFFETMLVKQIREERKKFIDRVRREQFPVFKFFRSTFLSRFLLVKDNKIRAELDESKLTPEHKDFIWRWVRREINLVVENDQSNKLDALEQI